MVLMSVDNWSTAFLLTQAIEVPVYVWAARSLPGMKRVINAVGASGITHPVIWFCLPWETAPYVPLLLAAEGFAVGVEALWGRLWTAPAFLDCFPDCKFIASLGAGKSFAGRWVARERRVSWGNTVSCESCVVRIRATCAAEKPWQRNTRQCHSQNCSGLCSW